MKVFISYRRADSEAYAGRLHDNLIHVFEPSDVFMDVDNIAPGADFVETLDRELSQTDVMLVVIGPGWLRVTDEAGRRRIDNPEDFVLKEISTALERNISVIPVLVNGASIPKFDHLPKAISALARKQAVQLHHEQFASDVERLAESIQKTAEQKQNSKPEDFARAVAQEYNRVLEFVNSEEVDFAQILENQEVEWFYNPNPNGDRPRFLIRGLPNLEDRFYRLDILEKVDDIQNAHYSELSEVESLLVVTPKNQKFHWDIPDYRFLLVDKGSWTEIKFVRCGGCETLHADDRPEPYTKDDYDSFDHTMFVDWCPDCQSDCPRCGQPASHGGLCANCQADLERWLEDE